jgi:hypothetical protein
MFLQVTLHISNEYGNLKSKHFKIHDQSMENHQKNTKIVKIKRHR